MQNDAKDVPNGELVPEQSELQLADVRIRELERELQEARDEIARLKQQIETFQHSTPAR
jgi:predicted  nucleic acid-binding Zn-ribbon protein